MNSKIIEKIKKLLSLSKSDNEHEAANAAAAAAGLMAQHQISVATLGEDDDAFVDATLGSYTIDSSCRRKVPWKADLAFGVASSFGCKYHYSGASLCMVGRSSDVDAVKYIYMYLVREINRLAEESWEGYTFAEWDTPKAYKGAFRTGASITVRKRLHDSRKENLEKEKQGADVLKCQAIIRVEKNDEAIEKFYEQYAEDNNFKNFKSQGTIGSIDGLNAGKKAGNNINLGNNKGLNGGSNKLGKPQNLLGE